ncbi:hypothetical protein VM1G_11362 [Cytospora mali]|uniref:Uncharacterized protein n=1 Tax=Cytospora mali TaxID=578113 RepID=A0A194VQH1_CYTMA|nr:hypothetical protein VM1G_11362 [Valsa mali]
MTSPAPASTKLLAVAGCRDAGRSWGGNFGLAADCGPEDAAGVGHVPGQAIVVAAAGDIHPHLAVDAGQDIDPGAEDHRTVVGVEVVVGCIRTGWEPDNRVYHRVGVLEGDGPLYLLFQHDHHAQADPDMEDTVDSHQQRGEQVVERVEEDRSCKP